MGSGAEETRVFLSYAHEHSAKVGQVAAQLRGIGYEVFFDQSSLDQNRRGRNRGEFGEPFPALEDQS